MCRETCTVPDWHELPKGPSGLPFVHGMPMTEEEYLVTGWHSRGTYSVAGATEYEWIAPLAGHQAWARRQHERVVASRTRREADEEWSRHIESMVEAHNR